MGMVKRMSKFKVGDRVRMKGVVPSCDEYDEGHIVHLRAGIAKVRWVHADTGYNERVETLELIPELSASWLKLRTDAK